MITDDQLNSIAVSFGIATMGLILVFHLITRNTQTLRSSKK